MAVVHSSLAGWESSGPASLVASLPTSCVLSPLSASLTLMASCDSLIVGGEEANRALVLEVEAGGKPAFLLHQVLPLWLPLNSQLGSVLCTALRLAASWQSGSPLLR